MEIQGLDTNTGKYRKSRNEKESLRNKGSFVRTGPEGKVQLFDSGQEL